MVSMTLEEKAKAFATLQHGRIGQVRKHDATPYINHPAAVVELVRSVPHTEEMLAAAWLHDVVEDTPVTLNEIEFVFGLDVATLVEMLTDVSQPEDGNRAARKAIDRAHTAMASPAAKTVKLADLIENGRNILANDPKFARVYLDEKAQLLEVLREGDPILWAMAASIVDEGRIALGMVGAQA